MDSHPPPAKTGRDLILSRAEQLFSESGYEGVSIRDIARACGVSNAAIYYYFANKQELYVQVLLAALTRMTASLTAAAQAPGTCRERLEHVARTHARLARSKRSLAQFAIRDLVRLGRDAIQQVLPHQQSHVPAAIEAILREGMEEGEVRPIDTSLGAYVLLAMLNALNTQILLGLRDQPDEESIRFVIQVFMDGVAPHPEGATSKI
jgi:AcrR family transcriptional regulator